MGILRVLVLLAVGIPALMLSLKVTRVARAARIGKRLDIDDLQRAITLDPNNPVYYQRLGFVYAFGLDHVDLAKAKSYSRVATELNPHRASYWSDRAVVCDSVGDADCAARALRRALSLSPMAPRLEWLAGNHYLQAGQPEQAMGYFRRLLALDETYAQPVFQVCLSAVEDPEAVYQQVLPPTKEPQLKLAYVNFLSEHGDMKIANRIWSQISSEGLSCKFSDVGSYLQRLCDTGEMQQATWVWKDLERAGVVRAAGIGKSRNLVYNGGFELTPLNAGFDWCALDTPYVEADFQAPSAYQGSRCLRVDYAAGQNLESEPVYELVPVGPHRMYRLTAYVRSEGITSDSGPRLRVQDPECPSCLSVSSPTTVGTTAWHPVKLDFTTGANTHVIRLSVWRPRSWTFPMEISGSFWLDDVSLEAINSMPREVVSTR